MIKIKSFNKRLTVSYWSGVLIRTFFPHQKNTKLPTQKHHFLQILSLLLLHQNGSPTTTSIRITETPSPSYLQHGLLSSSLEPIFDLTPSSKQPNS